MHYRSALLFSINLENVKVITKQVNATTTLDWFRIISSANKFPASNFRLLIFFCCQTGQKVKRKCTLSEID